MAIAIASPIKMSTGGTIASQGPAAPHNNHTTTSSTGSAQLQQNGVRTNGAQHLDSPNSSLRDQSSVFSTLPTYTGPVLKSQYPSNSVENHVEYILVASFDIDHGSVVEHQYPGAISGDEHMLAELMLPDQAHMRSMDWTIFFLHKDTTNEEEAREERRKTRRVERRQRLLSEAGQPIPDDEELAKDIIGLNLGDADQSEISSMDSGDDAEGPPLIYVLNLVNTKQDQTVKRGAIVKAMAICTRHSFLHIYKPLLLLALEEYFRAPVLDTLALLYNAVNSMDLSLMPRLTPLERHVLQTSDVKEMFVEKFSIMIQQRMTEDEHRLSQNSEPSSVGSPARKSRYQVPRDTHEFESRVLYNGVPVPIKVPVAIAAETVGDFSLVKLISTFATPHATSPQPFTLHPHLTTSGPFTNPIIVLINALLTQKRIIFLGHNQPSGSVAEAVLAACALASSGIMKGFTRHAFPYTDLTKIDDLLKVPGFIAGVTNPRFATKPEWWDLLCDLPTGRMKISTKIESAPITEGLLFFQNGGPGALIAKEHSMTNGDSKNSQHNDPTGDNAFMESVMGSISNRHGEPAVRNKFRAWVHRFTLIAAAFEEVVYGASALNIGAAETDEDSFGFGVVGHGLVWPDEPSRMREIQANVGRIEGWRQTRSYYSLIRDLARNWEKGEYVRGIDLGYQIDKLRLLRLGDAGSADVYMAIARAVERAGVDYDDPDYEDPIDLDDPENAGLEIDEELEMRLIKREQARYNVINQLLSVMPETNGGLFYLGLGLFHKDIVVREAMVGLLQRIMVHDAGRHFWANLGRFAKLAFFRVKRESEAASIQVSI